MLARGLRNARGSVEPDARDAPAPCVARARTTDFARGSHGAVRQRVGPVGTVRGGVPSTTRTERMGDARHASARRGAARRGQPVPATGAGDGPGRDETRTRGPGLDCSPEQIRTAVSALRGRRPRPLDDGAVVLAPGWVHHRHRVGGRPAGRPPDGSGGRTRTPNDRTRTCCVTDYTTPERAVRPGSPDRTIGPTP